MKFFGILLPIFFGVAAHAVSIDWTGIYRFEYVGVERPSLGDPSGRKSYGLNYLGLSPKIVVSDGVEINGKIDVLPAQDAAYSMSQSGEIWGQGVQAQSQPGNPNTLTTNKPPVALSIRELYLNVNQEYGSLLVGRAPFQFGLGMRWSAGNGPWDHWETNSDLIAYKFIIGNVSIMPMFSRVSVGPTNVDQSGPFDSTAASSMVQDETIDINYDSQDSGSNIGLIMTRRQSSYNDTPIGNSGYGGPGATVHGGYAATTTGLTFGRKWETFQLRLEGDFLSGDTGIQDASNNSVITNAYGIVTEMNYQAAESKYDYSLKMGIASGDNPTTTNSYEGFQFNRNYRIAQLMFRHRLGQYDLLQTNVIKDTLNHGVPNSIDDETISNAIFIAPKIKYAMSDRWDLNNTLVWGQLMQNPNNAVGFSKDLGLEWDIETVYKPRSNMQWVNDLGLLFPGAAFKDGSATNTYDAAGNITSSTPTGYSNGFTYGFESKIAITF